MTDPAPSGSPDLVVCSRPKCPVQAACVDEAERGRWLMRQDAARLGLELMRFELHHREEKCARVILGLSMGRGSRTVCFPNLAVLGELIGATKGNVSTALESLHNMRIVRIQHKGKEAIYEFNPKSDEWRCRSMVTADKAKRAMDMVAAYNTHLLNANGDPSNFPASSDTDFLGGAVPVGTVPQGTATQDELWGDFPRLD
jgi:hypothetical protein